MVEFVGLPWDPNCLDFHKTGRTVITASKWQVRQAITRAHVGRWRNYERFLGPLRRLMDVNVTGAATDVPSAAPSAAPSN
jgi:hypothetical protein